MDEREILCHYSANPDRRKVTFQTSRLAPSKIVPTAGAGSFISSPSGPADQSHQQPESFVEVTEVVKRDRNRCCHWIFKMACSKFCIFFLIVKIFLLGVILPVHLQHVDHHDHMDYGTDDTVHHGYPNSVDGGNDVPQYGYNGFVRFTL